MKVDILASGSSGNCVLIDDCLVIDAGARVVLSGNAKPEAVLLTHSHTDHTRFLQEKFGGLPFYTTQEVADDMQKRNPFFVANMLKHDTWNSIEVGDNVYSVYVFKLKHDAPCIGFAIAGCDETILYATDFNEILTPITLSMFDRIFIECNNTLGQSDMLDVYMGDKTPKDEFHRRRSYYNHCNATYLYKLFEDAGWSEERPCDIPTTLLHKSSCYYAKNPEQIVRLCKITNVQNANYEYITNAVLLEQRGKVKFKV